MHDIVGYMFVDGTILCVDCTIGYDAYAESVYDDEARRNNTQCCECGKYLVDISYNEGIPEECPECGRSQYFMEILDDDSVECYCGWNDGNKPSFDKWKKDN